MLPWFTEQYGNPHSVEHVMGRGRGRSRSGPRPRCGIDRRRRPRDRVHLRRDREQQCRHQGRRPLRRAYAGDERRRIVTIATEHKCVLESVADLADEGFEPVFLPVGRTACWTRTCCASVDGADPAGLGHGGEQRDRRGAGYSGARAYSQEAGALFHSDAAQAVGKIPVDLTGWKVDLASVSGHKIYGPKGIGALLRAAPAARALPLFPGVGRSGDALGHAAGATDGWTGRGVSPGGGGNGARTTRASARCVTACSTHCGAYSRDRHQRQHHAAHRRQSEPDLPGRDRAGDAGTRCRICASRPVPPVPRPRSSHPMCCAHWVFG